MKLTLFYALTRSAWFASTVQPPLTPNARPENYCDLPGSEESVRRVGNRLLFAHERAVQADLAAAA